MSFYIEETVVLYYFTLSYETGELYYQKMVNGL
jgi:hypothetical protein